MSFKETTLWNYRRASKTWSQVSRNFDYDQLRIGFKDIREPCCCAQTKTFVMVKTAFSMDVRAKQNLKDETSLSLFLVTKKMQVEERR